MTINEQISWLRVFKRAKQRWAFTTTCVPYSSETQLDWRYVHVAVDELIDVVTPGEQIGKLRARNQHVCVTHLIATCRCGHELTVIIDGYDVLEDFTRLCPRCGSEVYALTGDACYATRSFGGIIVL